MEKTLKDKEKDKDKDKEKKKKKQIETDKFKQKYFEYYDDIKIPSHKITDW